MWDKSRIFFGKSRGRTAFSGITVNERTLSNRQHILTLFKKYLANDCTEQEAAKLLDLIRSEDNRGEIEELIYRHLNEHTDYSSTDAAIAARVFEKLHLTQQDTEVALSVRRSVKIFPLFKVAAAVIFIVLSSFIVYYFFKSPARELASTATVQDVAPGGNKAVLTLTDGRQLSLGEMQLGSTTTQDGMVITKSADGQVEYSSGKPSQTHGGVNTIRTPRGGQFRVVLPDGSKVWLNAASSLTYPSVFSGNERRVQLTGEGYFEIVPKLKHNQKIPFVVETAKQQIEVLGTRFNVNAYEEEAGIKTTLIEGKVKVITENETVILKPNQEFVLKTDGIITQPVEVDMAIDWKNGDFIFANDDIHNVMQKITRWYNVEAVYDNAVSPVNLNGQISRSRNLSEVLRMLELSGNLTFRIDNGVIHIYQNK